MITIDDNREYEDRDPAAKRINIAWDGEEWEAELDGVYGYGRFPQEAITDLVEGLEEEGETGVRYKNGFSIEPLEVV